MSGCPRCRADELNVDGAGRPKSGFWLTSLAGQEVEQISGKIAVQRHSQAADVAFSRLVAFTRALARGRFVAEGEDLLAAADAAGWPALERYVLAGSGLEGVEVDAKALNRRPAAARLGDAGAGGV